MSATMPRRVPGFRVALVAFLSISFLVLIGCQKKEIEELLGSELFSLSLGKLENQIDLFPSSSGTMEKKTTIDMRDGWFYVANGSSGKVMVFSSYGDLIFLLYNAQINPTPVFVSSPAPAGSRETSAPGDLASTRAPSAIRSSTLER